MLLVLLFLILFVLNDPVLAEEKTFSWEVHEKAISYKVQVCSDKNCANVIYEKVTTGNKIYKKFPAGRYYFRLAPISRSKKIGFYSKPKQFIVVPGIVRLNDPKFKAIVEYDVYTPVELEWNPVDGASSYVVVLTSKTGKKVRYKSNKNKFMLKEPRNGSYFWSVYALTRDGVKGDKSEIRELIFKKIPPQVTNIAQFEEMYIGDGDKRIVFEGSNFQKYALNIKYRPKISDRLKEIYKIETKKQFVVLKKPLSGFYTVKISGLYLNRYVTGKEINFRILDIEKNKNSLKFDVGIGTPKTSLTSSSAPLYTNIADDSPESLKVMSLAYARDFGKTVVKLKGSQTFDSKYLAFLVLNAQVGLKSNFFKVSLSPHVGYSAMSFKVKDSSKAANFLVSDIMLPYVGLDLGYEFGQLKGLSAEFTFNWMGPFGFANQTVYEFDFSVRYLTSFDIFIYAGYYGYDLKGVYQDSTNPKLKVEDFSQSYSGGKIGMGYEF